MGDKMKYRLAKIPAYVFISITSITAVIPFYIMFVMGTYKNEDIFKGLRVVPGDYIAENFETIMQGDVLTPYINSISISLLSVISCIFISSLCGYGLSKFDFKGKKIFKQILMITLMMPYQISLAGYLMEMKWFGLNNTIWPMIFVFFANPFGAYWMTQYIGTAIPGSLIESARIDGAGEFRIYSTIVFPLTKPAIITLSLLIFLWSWNNFIIPLVFVTDPKQYTLPLFISTLGGAYRVDYAAKLLNLTLATIPVLVFFSVFSKYLIKGMTVGALKE
ncbi:MAG: carbohydrate ABC transporter permease [Lachnospiraceae bacterium]